MTSDPCCPVCGAPSLATITDHSCADCADTYVYCPAHAETDLSRDELLRMWAEGEPVELERRRPDGN